MSRIGKRILTIPEGVSVKSEGNVVTVTGPKGSLSTEINKNITVIIKDNEVSLECANDEFKRFYGTANALIANMIEGVSKGYSKKLEAVGVGYRFQLKGDKLVINAGYSHPVEIAIPEGIKVEVPAVNEALITGIDKCLVGEFAANVRKVRKPEPYKGKGIRYSDEVIHRKEGKKAS